MAEILLNCWTLGGTACFTVEIVPSKTVGHLKDAIKKEKEHALKYIDADQLEIWKVNDPAQRTVPAITDV